jgi:hypothetical protein
LLNGIDEKVEAAIKKLNEVDKSEAKLVLGTEPVREKLGELSKKIQGQKTFLNRYLATAKNERDSVFY